MPDATQPDAATVLYSRLQKSSARSFVRSPTRSVSRQRDANAHYSVTYTSILEKYVAFSFPRPLTLSLARGSVYALMQKPCRVSNDTVERVLAHLANAATSVYARAQAEPRRDTT